MKTYEYAGFQYEVIETDGQPVDMKPLPGQHPAAYKDKHRRNAIDCWESAVTRMLEVA